MAGRFGLALAPLCLFGMDSFESYSQQIFHRRACLGGVGYRQHERHHHAPALDRSTLQMAHQ